MVLPLRPERRQGTAIVHPHGGHIAYYCMRHCYIVHIVHVLRE